MGTMLLELIKNHFSSCSGTVSVTGTPGAIE